MRTLEVEIEHRWAVIIRGPQSWEFCQQAARQKPTWSRAGRGWIVTERTARDVVALAEHAGLNVVVSGAPGRLVQDVPVEEPSRRTADESGLW